MPARGPGEVVALDSGHETAGFACGNPALDGWLQTRALRNQESGDSRTFVLLEGARVIGFYALATASVARVGLPGNLRRNAPDPVSLLLLGQLAVAGSHARKGLGRHLLRDALLRAAGAARLVGFRALATHPIDDAALDFYARFGFTSVSGSHPPLMAMPLQRLVTAVAAAHKP